MKEKWLLISIEIFHREIYGKSLIISEALKNNYKCIIGSRQAFFKNFKFLPNGIFLCKSASNIDKIYLDYAKRSGNEIVCLDEEGFVESSLDHLVKYRLNTDTIKYLKKYFLWGNKQKLAFEKSYPAHKKIFINSGNPRVDLWTNNFLNFYGNVCNEIKKKYGSFILIPTSFSPANHYYGPQKRLNMFSNIYSLNQEAIDKEKDYIEFVNILLTEMIQLIDEISKKYPFLKIVIKVHPSENKSIWKKLEKDFDQVLVCENYTVTELIKSSLMVIQSESTTAVEAYLSKIPVISYIPESLIKHQEKLLEVPIMVSRVIKKKSEVFEFISNVLNEPKNELNYQNDPLIFQKLNQWLSNINQNNAKHSFEKIIKEIDQIKMNHKGFKNKYITRIHKIYDYIFGYFLDTILVFTALIDIKNLLTENLRFKLKIRELGYGNLKIRLQLFILLKLEKIKILNFILLKVFNNKLISLKFYLSYGQNKQKDFNKKTIDEIMIKSSSTLKIVKPNVKELDQNLFIIF